MRSWEIECDTPQLFFFLRRLLLENANLMWEEEQKEQEEEEQEEWEQEEEQEEEEETAKRIFTFTVEMSGLDKKNPDWYTELFPKLPICFFFQRQH